MKTEFLSELRDVSIDQVMDLLKGSDEVVLSKSAFERMEKGRDFLERSLQDKSRHYYGINTGFGSLYNVRISDEQIEKLQYNLVVSHACGTGDKLNPDIIRIMMLLKIRNLAFGYSGARVVLVNKLIELYNNNVIPVVYEQGSLGASGDLAPLAHLSLPLIGDGEVYYEESVKRADEVFGSLGIEKIALQSKEGLAMLNGTQFSTSFGVFGVNEGERLANLADIVAALSMEAFNCNTSPFDPLIHNIRPHQGQISVAEKLNRAFIDSDISERRPKHVQDPYSFRCVPQVHGASEDALNYVKKVVTTEINSVTDNPSVFPDEEQIISAGNFHAQPIALALDFLAIGLAELANISERRCFQLLDGKRGLPPFLTPNPGVNSGFMILQYTAASIVSQNKQLCSPASVDSIVSCSGQEDHVSMAANAGTKLYKVVKNLETVLAIEFMIAVQALDIRKYRINPILRDFIAEYRLFVPFMEQDRPFYEDIQKTRKFLSRSDIGTKF